MLKNYVKVAFRTLRRQKAYAFLNIAGLTVGMVCCLLILLYVQDELRYDRHHENAGHIYRVVLDGSTRNGLLETAQTAPAWGPMLAAQYPEVVQAVRFKPPNQKWLVNYQDRRFFEKGFVFADSSVFDVFSFPLVRGNPETALVAPFTVVLTETTARKYFGQEDPIGKTLRLDNTYDFTVTGILKDVPRQSHFEVTLLASITSLQTPIYGDNFLQQNIGPALYTYLLLQPGTEPGVLDAKLPSFVEEHIGTQLASFGVEMRPYLQPLTDIHLHSNLENEIAPNGDAGTIYAFSAIALFILLIACINFMNLATARSSQRAREVGMRKVLGAERGQLVGQFLGESMLMTLAALVLALALVWPLLPLFNTLAGKTLSLAPADLPGYLFALLALAVFVGLVAGSYPALFLSSFRPITVLKGSASSRSGGALLRKGLVVFQFAISIFLMIGTAVVYTQLDYLHNRSLGFEKEHVVVMQLTDPQIRTQYQAFRTRVEQVPGVVAASASSSAPGGLVGTALILPEGVTDEESTLVSGYAVDHDLVETLGLTVVAGRAFSRDHAADVTDGFMINETAARTFGWMTPEDAVGRSIRFTNGPEGHVIGVVHDFHNKSLRQNIEPLILTMQNEQAYQYLFARIRPGDPRGTVEALEAAWQAVFPAYVFEYSFLDEDFNRLYAAEDQLRNLFSGFALVAILIACLGLFGLASFTAEQRTKEIGVRKVMGASVGSIVLLLSKAFSLFVLLAFVVAAPLAYLTMSRWLDGFAYHTEINLLTVLAAGIGALVIAWLTVAYQAIRAATADPVQSLRYE